MSAPSTAQPPASPSPPHPAAEYVKELVTICNILTAVNMITITNYNEQRDNDQYQKTSEILKNLIKLINSPDVGTKIPDYTEILKILTNEIKSQCEHSITNFLVTTTPQVPKQHIKEYSLPEKKTSQKHFPERTITYSDIDKIIKYYDSSLQIIKKEIDVKTPNKIYTEFTKSPLGVSYLSYGLVGNYVNKIMKDTNKIIKIYPTEDIIFSTSNRLFYFYQCSSSDLQKLRGKNFFYDNHGVCTFIDNDNISFDIYSHANTFKKSTNLYDSGSGNHISAIIKKECFFNERSSVADFIISKWDGGFGSRLTYQNTINSSIYTYNQLANVLNSKTPQTPQLMTQITYPYSFPSLTPLTRIHKKKIILLNILNCILRISSFEYYYNSTYDDKRPEYHYTPFNNHCRPFETGNISKINQTSPYVLFAYLLADITGGPPGLITSGSYTTINGIPLFTKIDKELTLNDEILEHYINLYMTTLLSYINIYILNTIDQNNSPILNKYINKNVTISTATLLGTKGTTQINESYNSDIYTMNTSGSGTISSFNLFTSIVTPTSPTSPINSFKTINIQIYSILSSYNEPWDWNAKFSEYLNLCMRFTAANDFYNIIQPMNLTMRKPQWYKLLYTYLKTEIIPSNGELKSPDTSVGLTKTTTLYDIIHNHDEDKVVSLENFLFKNIIKCDKHKNSDNICEIMFHNIIKKGNASFQKDGANYIMASNSQSSHSNTSLFTLYIKKEVNTYNIKVFYKYTEPHGASNTASLFHNVTINSCSLSNIWFMIDLKKTLSKIKVKIESEKSFFHKFFSGPVTFNVTFDISPTKHVFAIQKHDNDGIGRCMIYSQLPNITNALSYLLASNPNHIENQFLIKRCHDLINLILNPIDSSKPFDPFDLYGNENDKKCQSIPKYLCDFSYLNPHFIGTNLDDIDKHVQEIIYEFIKKCASNGINDSKRIFKLILSLRGNYFLKRFIYNKFPIDVQYYIKQQIMIPYDYEIKEYNTSGNRIIVKLISDYTIAFFTSKIINNADTFEKTISLFPSDLSDTRISPLEEDLFSISQFLNPITITEKKYDLYETEQIIKFNKIFIKLIATIKNKIITSKSKPTDAYPLTTKSMTSTSAASTSGKFADLIANDTFSFTRLYWNAFRPKKVAELLPGVIPQTLDCSQYSQGGNKHKKIHKIDKMINTIESSINSKNELEINEDIYKLIKMYDDLLNINPPKSTKKNQKGGYTIGEYSIKYTEIPDYPYENYDYDKEEIDDIIEIDDIEDICIPEICKRPNSSTKPSKKMLSCSEMNEFDKAMSNESNELMSRPETTKESINNSMPLEKESTKMSIEEIKYRIKSFRESKKKNNAWIVTQQPKSNTLKSENMVNHMICDIKSFSKMKCKKRKGNVLEYPRKKITYYDDEDNDEDTNIPITDQELSSMTETKSVSNHEIPTPKYETDEKMN